MKLVSIDVGIKNMGVCLLNLEARTVPNQGGIDILLDKLDRTTLEDWKLIDLTSHLISDTMPYKCSFIQKNKKLCKNKPVYNNDFNKIAFCNTHAKAQNGFFFTKEVSISFLQKQSLAELLFFKKEKQIYFLDNIVLEDKIASDTKVYKKDIIAELMSYTQKRILIPIVKTKAHDISLIDIGISLTNKFNAWLGSIINTIDCVVIENQISPIANRMKTIQGMIAQYFIMNGITSIKFISSSNKLNPTFKKHLDSVLPTSMNIVDKQSIVPKGKEYYKQRKQAGLKLTTVILNSIDITHNYHTFFENHIKKDDLADCLLQGIWYIYHIKE